MMAVAALLMVMYHLLSPPGNQRPSAPVALVGVVGMALGLGSLLVWLWRVMP